MPDSIRICEASADTLVEFIEAAADDDANGPKSFKMTAYTGGKMLVGGFYDPVVVDLSGLKVSAKSRPILRDHSTAQIVGHTDAITINSGSVKVSGVLSAANEHAAEVVASAGNGFPWQASIGAAVTRASFIDEGETVQVNGRSFTGPLVVARQSVLREVSFVALGADDNTTAKVAAASAGKTLGVDTMGFEQWLAAKGIDVNAIDEATKTALQAAYDAEQNVVEDDDNNNAGTVQATATTATVQATATTPAIDLTARREAEAAETERLNTIRAACSRHETEHGQRATFDVQGNAVDVEAHAIRENWDETRVELELLRASRPTAPAGHSRSHDRDCTLQAMQGASLVRAGVALDNSAFGTMQAVAIGVPGWLRAGINDDDRQLVMETAHRFADMSMVDICGEAIRLDGSNVPTGRSNVIQAAFSGSSLTSIFTTNVNTAVLATYMEAGDTTGGWTSERDVADFKSNERPRMGKGPNLEKLPRGGEADHLTRSDSVESYKLARYAKQFIVDEQDIIDDSFDALADTPREMGLAAARLRPDLVYAILLANDALGADNVALFHTATHGNLITSSALADATLKTAIAGIETQQENSVNLNLRASHLIVPSSLKHTAAGLVRSSTLIRSGDTDTVQGSENTLASIESLMLVSDARLENGVTDPATGTAQSGSATSWYLASSMGHNIEVGYLRGTGRVPQVRAFNLSEGKWGVGWDVKMDIGAKALDYRGLHKANA